MNIIESYTKSILDLENSINRLSEFMDKDKKIIHTINGLKSVQQGLINHRNYLINRES